MNKALRKQDVKQGMYILVYAKVLCSDKLTNEPFSILHIVSLTLKTIIYDYWVVGLKEGEFYPHKLWGRTKRKDREKVLDYFFNPRHHICYKADRNTTIGYIL